jgi:hypothetical protein
MILNCDIWVTIYLLAYIATLFVMQQKSFVENVLYTTLIRTCPEVTQACDVNDMISVCCAKAENRT